MADLSGRPHSRDDVVAPRVGGSTLQDHLVTFLDRAVIRPHTAAAGVDLGARAIPVDAALLIGASTGLNDAMEATAAWAQGADALCRCVREAPVGPSRYAAWCLLDAAARAVSRPEFRAALQRQLPSLVATHMPLHPAAALGAAGGRSGHDTGAGSAFGGDEHGDVSASTAASVSPVVARMLRRLEFDVFLRLYLDLTRSWSMHRPQQPALAADAAFAAELSDAVLVALTRSGVARHGAVARVIASSDAATAMGSGTSGAISSSALGSGSSGLSGNRTAVKSEPGGMKSEPGTSADAAAKQRAVIDRIMRTIGAASRQQDVNASGAPASSASTAARMTTSGPIPFTLDARRQQVARFFDACVNSRRTAQCCPRCGTFLPTEAARTAHMEQHHPIVPDLSAGPVAPTMLRLAGPTPAEFVRYRGIVAGTPEAAEAPMIVTDVAWQAANRKGASGRGGNPLWRRFG